MNLRSQEGRRAPAQLSATEAMLLLLGGGWMLRVSRIARRLAGTDITGARIDRLCDERADLLVHTARGLMEISVTYQFAQPNAFTLLVYGADPHSPLYVFVHRAQYEQHRAEKETRRQEQLKLSGVAHEQRKDAYFLKWGVAMDAARKEGYRDYPRVSREELLAQLRSGTYIVRLGRVSGVCGGQVIVDAEPVGENEVRVITLKGEVTVRTVDVVRENSCELYVFQDITVVEPKPQRFGGGTRTRVVYDVALKLRDLSWHLKPGNPAYHYKSMVEEAKERWAAELPLRVARMQSMLSKEPVEDLPTPTAIGDD